MATPLALIWDLIATDNASATFKKVGAEAKGTAAATKGLGATFAKMGGFVALAAIGVAAASAKMAIDFQESTTKLVTGAGESEDAIDAVRKGILKMAGSVGTMPEELSKGMFLIESAGFHGAHGLDVLHAAAEGAKVGGADMATVADGLTTAMKDYALPTSKAADVTSKLVATVGAGKTNMNDLATSLAKVLPFSANLGVSLKETLGAMATMTGEGIQASNAATMLKFTMMSLSNETPKGAKALLQVGLSAQRVTADLKSKGLRGTLTEITDAIGKKFPKGSAAYNKAMAAIVGGTRGMGAALALGGKHAKEFADNTKTIGSATTDAAGHVKGFAETQKDVAFQFAQVKAAAAALMIEFGSVLLPYISKAITFFTKHTTAAKILAGVIGGVLLASVIAFGVALVAATWEIMAAVAAIAAIAAGVMYAYNHFKIFRDVVNTVGNFIKDHWKQIAVAITGPIAVAVLVAIALFNKLKGPVVAAWNAIKSASSAVWGAIKAIISAHIHAIIAVVNGLKAAKNGVVAAWSAVRSATTSAWNSVKSAVSSGISKVISTIKGLPGKAKSALGNLGGLLKGAGAALMAGLASGIISGFNKILGVVRGMAAKIKALKGPIEYDRTLLTDEGHAIMEGLNKGLNVGFDKVKSNVAGMGAQLSVGSLDFASSAVRSSAVAASSAAASQRPITLDGRVIGILEETIDGRAKIVVANAAGLNGTIGRQHKK